MPAPAVGGAEGTTDLPNSSAPAPAPPASGAPPVTDTSQPAATSKTATRPISKQARELLREYFRSKEWPLNKELPRGAGAYDEGLQKIVHDYSLTRDQIARQLRNYKKERFGNAEIRLNLSVDGIRERIEEAIGPAADFVNTTLKKLHCYSPETSKNNEFQNFARIMQYFEDGVTSTILSLLIDCTDNGCFLLLAGLIPKWTEYLAEEFPKTAGGIATSELSFAKRKDLHKAVFMSKWMEQFGGNVSKDQFQNFGSFLHNALYLEWSYSAIDNDLPPVVFPGEDDLISKYARPVIYYVAGWTLFSLFRALTIAKSKRAIYTRLSEQHQLTQQQAEKELLPVELVNRRAPRNRVKMYCTQQYFGFMLSVESVFIANLTLEMMMAHVNGGLIHTIKNAILANDDLNSRFAELCNNNDGKEAFSEEERKALLAYVMERYANMRGAYFVKYMKGNRSGSAADTVVASQATRTKVVNAASKPPARKTVNGDEEMWKSAGESVLEESERLEKQELQSDNA